MKKLLVESLCILLLVQFDELHIIHYALAIPHLAFHRVQYGRTAKPHLCFTTISQLEREEENAESKIWVDIDEVGGDSEYTSDEQNIDEQYDDINDYDIDDEGQESNNRWSIFRSRNDNNKQLKSKSNENHNNNEEANTEIEEHPMRTDEWLVKVQLSPFIILPGAIKRERALFPQQFKSQTNRRIGGRNRTQLMKFSSNGFVVLIEEDDNNNDHNDDSTIQKSNQKITNVGKWQMNTNGICWTIQTPVPKGDNKEGKGERFNNGNSTCLYYHADIHLSKFQSKPRMLKGIVSRDRYDTNLKDNGKHELRKKLFRPVIGSFTAEGIGEDTLVLQYKDRGFGLSSNSGKT